MLLLINMFFLAMLINMFTNTDLVRFKCLRFNFLSITFLLFSNFGNDPVSLRTRVSGLGLEDRGGVEASALRVSGGR
jgi:hypothetical protein